MLHSNVERKIKTQGQVVREWIKTELEECSYMPADLSTIVFEYAYTPATLNPNIRHPHYPI